MIIRVFRVQVVLGRAAEFEEKFSTVSVGAVAGRSGLGSVQIGRPTEWSPREFVMVSRWDSIDALKAFAGPQWNTPHIPPGMEELIDECWIHHYEEYE